MKPEKTTRRSSILKPRKARNPLSDLDSEQQNAQDDDATTFDKNKRVSFSATKGIALFTMADHGNTIWHGVYEEPNVNMSESTDMAESLMQKLEASLETSPNIAESTVKSTPTEEVEDSEHCINISAMIGDLAKFYPKKAILESTNPSMTDHTEALINYKIAVPDRTSNIVDLVQNINKTDDISNEQSSCEMSITQVMSVDIETKEPPKPSTLNTYVYPKVNKENWVQDKENITIPLNIKEYENEDPNRYSILNRAQLKTNPLPQSIKASEQNCDLNFTNAISKMIEEIENNSPNPTDNVNFGLKRKSSDNLEEMLPESIGDKRKTIIFDTKTSDCDMSMTSAAPSAVLIKRDEKKAAFTNPKDRANMPKASRNTGDMSMADFLPNMASTQIFNLDERKFKDMMKNDQKTIIFNENEDDCNVSMTAIIPDAKLEVFEEKSNDALANNPKRKTIVFDEETAGCNMSMTNVLPTYDVNNMLNMNNVETIKNDKRKTIIFNREDPDHNMSMTAVLPSVGLCENVRKITDNEKRKTIIFNEDDAACDMSMTNILPSFKNDRKSLRPLADPIVEKRKTIIFNQEESVCNMSMTTVFPTFGLSENRKSIQISNNTETINNEKRKTIIFDENDAVCNMSMTAVLPSHNLSKNHRESILKDQIVYDQEESVCNMSMTNVFPTFGLSENRKSIQTTTNTETINNEKRKTIIFDENDAVCNMSMTAVILTENNRESIPKDHIVYDGEESVCNMSMTAVLPSKNDRKSIEMINNEKRKTIIFNPEESVCNMSMTTVLPSGGLSNNINKSIQRPNNTETVSNEKRKTIIFNSEESVCNMSMTSVLPSGRYEDVETVEKRKTIIFDQNKSDCNVSMTAVLPCVNALQIKNDDNIENVNEMRKSIIFDRKDVECDISMTDASPCSDLTERKSIFVNDNIVRTADSKEKTIVFNRSDAECDISLNDVFSSTKIMENMKNPEDDQKKCIISDENEMVDPKQKTINFNRENVFLMNTSKTTNSNKVGDKSIENVNNLTRKSVIFNGNNAECNTSITNLNSSDANMKSVIVTNNIEESSYVKDIDENVNPKDLDVSCDDEKIDMISKKETKRKTSFFNESKIPTFFINKMLETSLNTTEEKEDEIQRNVELHESRPALEMGLEFNTRSLNTSVQKTKLPISPMNNILAKKRKTSFFNETNIPKFVIDKIRDGSPETLSENEDDTENCVQNAVDHEHEDMEVSYYVSDPVVADPNDLVSKNLEEDKIDDDNFNPGENINVTMNKMESIGNVFDDNCGNDPKFIRTDDKDSVDNAEVKEESMKIDLSMQKEESIVQTPHECVNTKVYQDMYNNSALLEEDACIVNSDKADHREAELDCEENHIAHELSHNKENSMKELKNCEIMHNTLTANVEIGDVNKSITIVKCNELNMFKNISMKNPDDAKMDDEDNYVEKSFEYEENSKYKTNFTENFPENDISPESSHRNSSGRCENNSKIMNDSHSSMNSSKNKLLANISDISLVDTSHDSVQNCKVSENNSIFSDSNTWTSKTNSVSNGGSPHSKCPQEEIPQRSIQDILRDIDSSDFNKLDCRSRYNAETEWSFYLCQDSLTLKIQFHRLENENLNPKTVVSNIILEPSIDKNVSCEIFCAQIAIMNQLPVDELKSMCGNCNDVPKLLSHCSDVSKKARGWTKLLKFLYLQHGLRYENKKLSFKLANGLLRCIWEIVIDVKDLPYATSNNVTINIVCGESTIAESTFKSLIEEVGCDWNYLKNLADILYDYVRKSTKIEPLCNA